MSDDSTYNGERGRYTDLTRRRLMKAVGVSTLPLVAGCGGNETETTAGGGDVGTEGDGGTEGNGGSVNVVDQALKLPTVTNLNNINYNFHAGQNTPDASTSEIIWDYMGYFHRTEREWYPLIADDWSLEDGTATLQLNPDYTWHDGDPLTVDDIVAQFTVDQIIGLPMWDFAESVTAEDETTVAIELSETNPNVFWPSFMEKPVFVKREQYSDIIESWEDATTDDEESDVTSTLLNKQIGPDEVVGNGPFQIDTVTGNSVTMTRFEDYAKAENIDFSTIEAIGFSDAQSEYQAQLGDQIDVIDSRGGMPESVRNNMGDNWKLVTYPDGQDVRMVFNYESNTVGGYENREVRQAVAAVLNQTEFPPIGGSHNKFPVQYQTDMTNAQSEDWLSDSLSDFTNYGGPDTGWNRTDMATTLLESAGFERNGNDKWVDADSGNPLEIPVKYPAGWSGAVPMYRNAAEQLQEFGITAPAVGRENNTLFSSDIPQGNYELTWTVMSGRHPYDRFRLSMSTLETATNTPQLSKEKIQVPMPVGDPEGSPQEINLNEKIQRLGRTTDSETEQQLVTELAWAHNQWVPALQCWEKHPLHGITRDDWDWPASDDDFLRSHPYKVMKLYSDGIAPE